jgi:hypothetical protein
LPDSRAAHPNNDLNRITTISVRSYRVILDALCSGITSAFSNFILPELALIIISRQVTLNFGEKRYSWIAPSHIHYRCNQTLWSLGARFLEPCEPDRWSK